MSNSFGTCFEVSHPARHGDSVGARSHPSTARITFPPPSLAVYREPAATSAPAASRERSAFVGSSGSELGGSLKYAIATAPDTAVSNATVAMAIRNPIASATMPASRPPATLPRIKAMFFPRFPLAGPLLLFRPGAARAACCAGYGSCSTGRMNPRLEGRS